MISRCAGSSAGSGRAGAETDAAHRSAGGILVCGAACAGSLRSLLPWRLPQDFPHRDLIVFCAFWVVLGTLALQGLTLRPLMQRLNLPEDTSVEEETRLARQATARAAMHALRDHAQSENGSENGRLLYREYAARAAGGAEAQTHDGTLASLQERAVAAQRQTLLSLRRDGAIGDDAFHIIEEELDIIELTADSRVRTLDKPV